ncbi:MAG: PIN domain-containing protein [Rhodovibrio sp.]|nr:PIN domain-containing protein [Rhodovibrio sp.]
MHARGCSDQCAAADCAIAIPVQVLAELYRVLRRKGGVDPDKARRNVLEWRDISHSLPSGEADVVHALNVSARHGLQVFDALILAVAAAAGCDVLLSEDMQDGATFAGVTIVNPFAAHPDPRIAPYLPS